MGYLTTFTVYNDGCDQLEKHPTELAKILYDACGVSFIERNGDNQVALGCHANLITVQRPRHADSHTLYLHAGNIVTDVSDITIEKSVMLNSAISELEYQLKRLKSVKSALKKEKK